MAQKGRNSARAFVNSTVCSSLVSGVCACTYIYTYMCVCAYSVTMDTLYVRLVVLGRRPFAIHQSSLKRTTQGACSKYSTCNLLSLWWLLEKPFGLAFRKAVQDSGSFGVFFDGWSSPGDSSCASGVPALVCVCASVRECVSVRVCVCVCSFGYTALTMAQKG